MELAGSLQDGVKDEQLISGLAPAGVRGGRKGGCICLEKGNLETRERAKSKRGGFETGRRKAKGER